MWLQSSHWPVFPCSIGVKERPERLLLISVGEEQYSQQIEIEKWKWTVKYEIPAKTSSNLCRMKRMSMRF
jgi:hypothetical protein